MAFEKDMIRKQVISYAKDIYFIDASGGAMHTILDDFNCSDEDLEFCIEYMWHYKYTDTERILYTCCIFYLAMLSEKEREELLNSRYDEYSRSKQAGY